MDITSCRICSIRKGTLHIFNEIDDPQISAKIIYCCSRVKISTDDSFPSQICETCDDDLTTVYQFILKCEATDEKLRTMVSPQACKPSTETTQHIKLEPAIKLEDLPSHNDNYNMDADGDYRTSDTELKTTKVKSHKERRKVKHKHLPFCSICGHKSVSRSALVIHMRYHTGESPFQCENCDKKYKDPSSLKRHIERLHRVNRDRNFICENCGKGFYSKNDVKIHMRVHTGETPYVCSECSMRFTQMGALQRHKKRHSGVKPHTCGTCHKKFCTKEEMKLHLNVHTDEKKFCCSICNVQFKYQNSLKKHCLIHLQPNSYACNHCGRTFNQKGNLKGHISRRHSEKSGCCGVCLKSVSNLEVHMRRHTGERPLKCELCTSTFIERKSLARHINYRHKHTDKFKCSYEGCSMTFPSRPMLRFHVAKLHETGIPFPCDRCSRGFYRKNDLARHKIGTHKERLQD